MEVSSKLVRSVGKISYNKYWHTILKDELLSGHLQKRITSADCIAFLNYDCFADRWITIIFGFYFNWYKLKSYCLNLWIYRIRILKILRIIFNNSALVTAAVGTKLFWLNFWSTEKTKGFDGGLPPCPTIFEPTINFSDFQFKGSHLWFFWVFDSQFLLSFAVVTRVEPPLFYKIF